MELVLADLGFKVHGLGLWEKPFKSLGFALTFVIIVTMSVSHCPVYPRNSNSICCLPKT